MTATAPARRERPPARSAAASVLTPYLVAPPLAPPLDPDFRPLRLARRAFEAATLWSRHAVPVSIAVEQPGGAVVVREILVVEAGHRGSRAGRMLCERLVKSLLWSSGGWRVWVDGPADLVEALRRHYASTAIGRFDATMLGSTVHSRPFEVVAAPRAAFPMDHDAGSVLGRHLDGCRIGFDLGASARKAAAVLHGRVVFSEDVAWDPAQHADPQWHVDQIMDSLRRAASHLPRVDAIGGSAAGIYVDNEVRVASLFRAVPPDLFRGRLARIFRELQVAWGGIPFVVLNDGEVTALAGAMLTGVTGLLGISMGSSEAAGYVRPDGRLTAWLNELAFVPIDVAPGAPTDEWSGDRGCGVQYLSQQAAARLLPRAGIKVHAGMPTPERLAKLQCLIAAGDGRAHQIYETIGTFLGYALLEYRELYAFEHLLLLGGVMNGPGGQLIEGRAMEVLEAEDAAATVTFHRVSEHDKRHGQAVAAASLPSLAG
jgi:predicted NBD/HSP70 family sugar kinase